MIRLRIISRLRCVSYTQMSPNRCCSCMSFSRASNLDSRSRILSKSSISNAELFRLHSLWWHPRSRSGARSWHRSIVQSRQSSSSSSSYPDDERHAPKRVLNVTWYSVVVSMVLGSGLYYIYSNLKDEKKLKIAQDRVSALAEAGLGTSEWSLTDQFNKRRSYSEFRGQWLMIYFGFCHCPDICPEEIEKLVGVTKGIDSDSSVPDIQPIFITLDPERDTAEYMKKYCQDFSAKLIGFTGTTAEIADVAKSYRVYYSLGEKDSDGDYIVDHTICMYLINPEGQLVDVYERRAQVDGIIKGSTNHMKEYKQLCFRTTH